MGRMGTPLISFNRYNEMAKALKKTDRSILYSLCSWGEDFVHTVSCRHASERQRLTESLSGADRSQTPGVYLETSTTRLLARMSYADVEL